MNKYEDKNIESQLMKHSYDLIIFPKYLSLLSPHISINIKEEMNDCDIYGIYITQDNNLNYKFARFLADKNGIATNSKEIYQAIHQIFKTGELPGKYMGFRGCGRFPISPLIQVGFFYQKFGRGIFKDGDSLPTPCSKIESDYGIQIPSFRTTAPLR